MNNVIDKSVYVIIILYHKNLCLVMQYVVSCWLKQKEVSVYT